MIRFLRLCLSLSLLLFCLSFQARGDSVSLGQITVRGPFGHGGRSRVSLTQMFDDAHLCRFWVPPMSALHDCANLGDAGASPGWPRGTAGEWSTSGWEGTFEFTATSFQSSLSPSGTLTINGSLSVSALVNLCNPPGQNCIPTDVSFPVLDNAQWRYLADFARTPEAGVDGLYRFENLTITVVPEPATVVLFLTGLGSLDLVQRLRRHAGGNRKHQRPVQTGLYSEDKWGRREQRDILP